MKRIFVPTKTGADWQPLLSKPKEHWQPGASAMTVAAAWEAASDSLPPEITQILDSSKEKYLQKQDLILALPEWQVQLPGGVTTSNTDVLAICRNNLGLCILGVEAKVLEDFGPLLAEKRAEASPGQIKRLAYLHDLLGAEHFDDEIRYQLLHRTASALLTAREFHAAAAVMLVHAFDTPPERRSDFKAFAAVMKANEIAPLVYKVGSFTDPALYLAWCDGNPKFRNEHLPSAL
jgi:hypothetical protein